MYLKAVLYKDVWLAPGSEAFELYHETKPDSKVKLDKLLKECNDRKNKLEGRK